MIPVQRTFDDFDILYQRLQSRYGDEERATESFRRIIWPRGFVCRRCGGRESRRLEARDLEVCHRCRTQHSLTAGTPMHGSRLKLSQWALVIFLSQRREYKVPFYERAKGGRWHKILSNAMSIGVSERQLRRWLTKLDCRTHSPEFEFIRAFMNDLNRVERASPNIQKGSGSCESAQELVGGTGLEPVTPSV